MPDSVSSFKINSTVFTPAILNVFTVSIIAVASDVSPVIVLPIKSVGSPMEGIALNTVSYTHLTLPTILRV